MADWSKLFGLAKNVPWDKVVEYGPQVAEGVKKFRQMREEIEESARAEARLAAAEAVATVEDQVAELTARVAGQREALDRLAAERSELAKTVEAQSARLKTAWIVSIASAVVAVAALVVAFVT